MPRPNVSIQLQPGGLGKTPSTADGVAGLLVVGIAKANCPLLTPKQVFSLTEVEALGFSAAADTADATQTYAQIRDFYAAAGEGKTLWLMTYAAATTMTQLCDPANANGLTKLLNASGKSIRILGVSRPQADNYVPTVGGGLDGDVYTAAAHVQNAATAYAAQHTPFVAIVDGRNFTGTPADLTDLTTLTHNSVAVCIGNRTGKKHADVGLLLGRLAMVPVQRKVSRRKNEAVTPLTPYLTSGGAIPTFSGGQLDAIHDKGFVFLDALPNRAGAYWSGDPTATATTDDYRGLARRRVINKAIELTARTYADELDDEVPLTATGRIEPSLVAYYRQRIQDAINERMLVPGEASAVAVLIDPTQNVLANDRIEIELTIVPVGYSSSILVKLGFARSV